MHPRTRRRLIDMLINGVVVSTLWHAGAGWWALLILPLAIWNFYDGMTRSELG